MTMTRREFGLAAGGLLTSAAFGEDCVQAVPPPAGEGRLTARAGSVTPAGNATSGPLGLEAGRDGLLWLPSSRPAGPLPLLVLLHGAGGDGARVLARFEAAAEAAGIAVLAPDSRGSTWDAVTWRYGPDVLFIDRALAHVFGTLAVDPARLTIGGFSDGATYALSLGLINGDLFPRIAAFSPGFLIDGPPHGRPGIFVSHGRADDILPIDRSSRRSVPALQTRGYEVTFREFDGGHEVPRAVAAEGLAWAARV